MQKTINLEMINLAKDHPLTRVTGEDGKPTPPCPACGKPFWDGQSIALIPIGPGENIKAMRLCREGLAYNAVCIPAHWWCVTGEEPDEGFFLRRLIK